MRRLVRFVGFHRQPSLGLLRGLLYLEVCESRSAFGIELKITTFRKWLLYFLVFILALFFGGQKVVFVSWVIGFHKLQSQHIAAQALHPLAKVPHMRLCCEHAGFCCEGWDCL